MFVGLRILAFPCNQFNGQEPGGSEEICSFADRQKVYKSLKPRMEILLLIFTNCTVVFSG